jgi:hypothetical protein
MVTYHFDFSSEVKYLTRRKRKYLAARIQALAITQRRLELLPNENEVTSGFEVLDLKNANPSMRGTQVLVHLPFL